MRYFLLTVVAVLSGLTSKGQVPVQDWRVHFSIFNAVGIAEANDRVFMACSNGIIEYDTDDRSVHVLTATNGLSDLGISAIEAKGAIAVVGYANGNIDVIEENRITNIPWIKKSQISGDKSVNSVYIDGTTIYVATNIGIVVIDNEKKEIKDTYYPYKNPQVNDLTLLMDTLYVATENGLYRAHKDHPFLNDTEQWTAMTSVPDHLRSAPISDIEAFGDRLVFAYQSDEFNADSLYYIDSGNVYLHSQNAINIHHVRADEGKLILSTYGAVTVLDEELNVDNVIFGVEGKFIVAQGSLYREGKYWIADSQNGLTRAWDPWNNEEIVANSPFADRSYRIDVQYGTVLVAAGGLTHNQQNNYFSDGVYRFNNESWTNFNYTNQDSMRRSVNWDFISVVVNPNNTNEMAFGSSSEGGMMVVKDGKTVSTVYDETNSLLERVNGRIVITDMKYDRRGNLWIVNTGTKPLKMMTPEGVWYAYTLGPKAVNQYPYCLMIDYDGTKWMGVKHTGLIAFNEGGTYSDNSDDRLRTLSAVEGYGDLPSIYVKSLAQGVNGEIWIGTEEGLAVLYTTAAVFDGGFKEYDARPILIEVDGEVERLLGESEITALAVDGGNRKWVGTRSSGIFCLSPDGRTEIYRYTAENSPLISNNILDIKIDLLTGEVYIATEKGLVSVRTDATLGNATFSNVVVFPNPVRPDYQGVITVQGLGYASDVKITDVAGHLVYKTTSNGGTAIWDGRTLQGDRVSSGVYLVWSAAADEKGKNVAKILLINR